MAEALSILASGVSIADVAVRLISYLKDVKQAAERIEDDVDRLISEVEALRLVHGSLEEEFKQHVQNSALTDKEKVLWFHTGRTLKEGRKLTRKLEDCVKEIHGEDPKVMGKRDGLLKQHRKRSRNVRLFDFHGQLHTYHGAIQIWLSLVSLYEAHDRQADTTALLRQLQTTVSDTKSHIEENDAFSLHSDSGVSLSYQEYNNASMYALERISSSVTAVEQCIERTSTNKHFDTPQLVDRFYTGREQEAEQLASWLMPFASSAEHSQTQRQFVIYGVGGSGKTQFCCKFADDNRESFWGVFWIDARSRQLLKQTLSQNVARLAGVDLNENAALHWLSNLEERWLLIIDNADDPEIKLDDYLPKGKRGRGHVLITTRNPMNQFYGNVGPGYFDFQGLNNDEASSLLLKAAGRPRPWDVALSRWATKISEALGYLALALAVAGASIREGVCQFHEYLDYHEEQRRQRPSHRRSQSASRERGESDGSKSGSVEATFDISYKLIADKGGKDARDALEMLKTFAFLHCENIRFDFLEQAVTNSVKESK